MTNASLERCARRLRRVTAKSLTSEPRKGHAGPNIVDTGLRPAQRHGIPESRDRERASKEFGGWKRSEALIISIVGKDKGGIRGAAEKVEGARKTLGRDSARSRDIMPSHARLWDDGRPRDTRERIRHNRGDKDRRQLPLIIKLSPSVPGKWKCARQPRKRGLMR